MEQLARKPRTRRRPRGVCAEAVWDDADRCWRLGEDWYDDRAAEAAVTFFPEHLCLTEGEWAGRPFLLEDWQADDIIRPLFGWKRPDGTRRYRRCYVWIPRKNGKALDVATPLPTPGGWTTMGEVRAGDVLFDEHGAPCRVNFATAVQHGRPCYRVAFSDGTSIVADADHRWWAKPKYGNARIVTTGEMRARLIVGAGKMFNWTIHVGGRRHLLAGTDEATVTVTAIDPVESRPVRCIEVDSLSRLYLAGPGLTPTHNTEIAAGIALLVLLGDGEAGGQVYSIATDKDQARLVFDKATAMVSKSPTLSGELECLKPSIYCPALNAAFKPLSGKPGGKHGLSASGLIGDEIHEWVSGELYQFIHDSEAARRQPLEFLISTAGKKGGYGEEVWDECQKILDGTIEDPETLVVVYAADPDDDWTLEATWRKANPNLGISKKLDVLATDCRRAQQLPRLENDFKRYHLNLWTEQAVRWLPIDGVDDEGRRFGWDHCAGAVAWGDLEERLAGLRCFGGLDLSAIVDLSALVWWFPVQDGLEVPVVLPRFFKPADLVKQHARRDKLPYDRWVEQGALVATPGNVVDYAFIQEQIYRDGERFSIAFAGSGSTEPHEKGIAIDRWNATETAVKLEQEGMAVALFGQGFASMSAPSKEIERLVLANGFHHGNHPILRRHAQVVAVESDPAGNIKPAKNRSTERIDGIVAWAMALGIAMVAPSNEATPELVFL